MYMRFSRVTRNAWAVTEPIQSTEPFAIITRRSGRCSVTIAEDHPLNLEEMAAILDHMQHRQAA